MKLEANPLFLSNRKEGFYFKMINYEKGETIMPINIPEQLPARELLKEGKDFRDG